VTQSGKKNSGPLYEIRRRRVLPTITAYAIVAWALVEAISLFVDAFDGPGIMVKATMIIAVAGFPVVLLIAWMFDISTEGFRLTDSEDENRILAATDKTFSSPVKRKLKQTHVAVLTCLPVADTTALDPEELVDLRAELAQHFEKTVSKFGGLPVTDSGLEYQAIFGHPRKNSDYLQQALDCGLALITDPIHSIEENNNVGFFSHRIGLHSGSVLVPRRGVKAGELYAHAILGETGRLATRIAHSAPPGRIVASAAAKMSLPETLVFKGQEAGKDGAGADHLFLLEKPPA
jgi:class 3 adenylate cyclase